MSGAINCPHCDGEGGRDAFINRGLDIADHSLEWVLCQTCHGLGAIDADTWERIKAARRMRDARIASGKSLLEAAREAGISPAELSAQELGRR